MVLAVLGQEEEVLETSAKQISVMEAALQPPGAPDCM